MSPSARRGTSDLAILTRLAHPAVASNPLPGLFQCGLCYSSRSTSAGSTAVARRPGTSAGRGHGQEERTYAAKTAGSVVFTV